MPELKTKTKTKTEKHFILVLIHQWHIRNYVAKYKFVRHVFPLLSTCPSNTIHCILGIHSLSVHYLLFLLWQSFERNFRQTAIAPRAAAAAWTSKRTQRDRWEPHGRTKLKHENIRRVTRRIVCDGEIEGRAHIVGLCTILAGWRKTPKTKRTKLLSTNTVKNVSYHVKRSAQAAQTTSNYH